MSQYMLNPGIALRGWRLVPYAYYIQGVRDAKGLRKDESELLLRCDGTEELDGSSPLVQELGSVKRSGLRTLLREGDYLSEVCATLGQLSSVNGQCRDCPFCIKQQPVHIKNRAGFHMLPFSSAS